MKFSRINKKFKKFEFEKIKKIEIHKDQVWTYDIEVPETHSFICNGIVSHNTAKSTLGQFVYKHVPKAQYVVGSEMTHAGLSASLTQDPDTNMWIVNAGALPLASGSICVIDEIDKVAKTDEIKSLDTVMELQQLPINKANINVKLPAETSILAIANPKFSRFDIYTELKEQVTLSEVNLSRYDLKWAFKDIADEKKDRKIVKRIINRKKIKSTIPSDFLSKYIVFARRLKPKLTKDTLKILEKYYINLRKKTTDKGGILQITTRQFEGLMRLSQAYAKLRLVEKTNKEDGKNAIKIFESFLQSFGFDPETGNIDIDKAQGRMSKKTRDKSNRMLEILKGLQKLMKIVPKDDFFKACSNEFTSADVEKFLRKAKQEGWIFEPKPRFYQVA